MNKNEKAPVARNIDEYIAAFPPALQGMMQQMRATIRKAAPSATETISYGMPAFQLDSVLVYFAGYKKHIGFYPTPSAIHAFRDEISQFKWAKGSVQFPLDEPLPLALVTKMVRFRVREVNGQKSAKTKKVKPV